MSTYNGWTNYETWNVKLYMPSGYVLGIVRKHISKP